MIRTADCGASHVRGERALRVNSMYVPVLRSCGAYALRARLLCTLRLRCPAHVCTVYALPMHCSCAARMY